MSEQMMTEQYYTEISDRLYQVQVDAAGHDTEYAPRDEQPDRDWWDDDDTPSVGQTLAAELRALRQHAYWVHWNGDLTGPALNSQARLIDGLDALISALDPDPLHT